MRIKLLYFCLIVLFVLLASALFYLQVVKGAAYRELSYRNSIRLLGIPAPRGVIYDRRARVVADNALSFSVFIVPQEAGTIDESIRKLSKVLEVPESLLKRNYKRNYYAPFAPCEVINSVSKRKALIVEEQKLDMPGVLVKEVPLRVYPYREALAHLVGYIGEIDKTELEFLRSYGYRLKDMIGKDGIERVADGVLRGRDGGMQIQVDNRSRQIKVLSSKNPKKGKDVYLTIDAGLQNFIWRMMKKNKGCALFMDIHTGEILSLVSSPSYDPNMSLAEVLYDKDAPFLNRAIMAQYPPGSLFKIVSAIAGLDTGKIQPNTTFMCKGKFSVGDEEFNCWNRDGHGGIQLRDAIVKSCNVYFYNLGVALGVDKLSEYARQFGFGKKIGIELFGEIEGVVPSRAWKRVEKQEPWYTGDTVNLSIGQGYLLVTPLQIARFIALVANVGELESVHIIKKVGSVEAYASKKTHLKIKKESFELVKKAMRGVVEDVGGTGFRAWSEVVSISAKTGTSQVGTGLKTHAWLAGFAPSDNPEVSFVIFLEHGGSGGDVAALIARKAVEYWYRHR